MWKRGFTREHDDRHTVSGAAMSFGLLMTLPRAAIGGNPGSTHPPPPTPNGVERPGRPTRPPEGTAQLHFPPAGRPEGLVRDDVGSADLGIHLQPERPPERAVAIEPRPAGEEIAVPELKHVLQEE